ncbi:MAG: hypothetical protein C0467_31245 [Planctomycetaceae bacterium]|nr:hypothetical protein [Planctomycetaceae bacterium]
MRTKRLILAALVSLFTSSALSFAQDPLPVAQPNRPVLTGTQVPPVPVLAPTEPPVPVPSGMPSTAQMGEIERGVRMWGSAEYLLWWVNNAPSPAPIVTTGPITGNLAPVLGQPGTTILIGGKSVNLGSRSGGRFTIGGWLNQESTLGLEGSYLFLASQSASQGVASSGATGSTFLALPFVDATTGVESSTRLALPGGFSGIVRQDVTNSLQGGELNALRNLVRTDAWTVTLLGGFRYLNLNEELLFTTNSTTVIGPPDVFITTDRFATNNNFYGGQFGARVERRLGNFFINATGKVALGSMQQQVEISGNLLTNDFNGLGVPQSFPGGYLTQPTNIGSRTRNQFAVITDLNVSLGYQLTSWARVSAGYSMLYLNNVVRPGDQVDRRLNPTQGPAFIGAAALVPGNFVGAAAPLPQFNQSDFCAHGLNFGLELRY